MTNAKILAIGDCNTLGVGDCRYNSFPEKIGLELGFDSINLGYTMATTREGIRLLKDNISQDIKILLIQFGLVDSYPTFKYSPYVPYYPDNFFKKQLRSIVKKYKKLCRAYKLNHYFGEKNVTPVQEYQANLEQMIFLANDIQTILIDTIPNKQAGRNKHILHYNMLMTKVAKQHSNCIKINLFQDFLQHQKEFYLDETHCNDAGYTFITKKILQTIT